MDRDEKVFSVNDLEEANDFVLKCNFPPTDEYQLGLINGAELMYANLSNAPYVGFSTDDIKPTKDDVDPSTDCDVSDDR